MRDYTSFFIDGAWCKAQGGGEIDVLDPSSEDVVGRIAAGSDADIDRAVRAARTAFPAWSRSSVVERLALLEAIATEYERRLPELAAAISEEMGAPAWLAEQMQAPVGLAHLRAGIEALQSFPFAERRGRTTIIREAIGVCALITPWNWPLNQIACKVVPALAAGCTTVLKPSEIAPFSAYLFAEVMAAAGTPAGVFNLVNGMGADAGRALASHPDVDMVSFTGSTRAGIEVARSAAPTIKRVQQELGGKSPNIILDDADFAPSVEAGVRLMMLNSGQSCNAPSRMLVPIHKMDLAAEIAGGAAANIAVGPPASNAPMGPVASVEQWNKIQRFIEVGIGEGARLVAGGLGKPAGFNGGYYVRPTVFAHVRNDMSIAREEIFGPVLVLIGYEDDEDAARLANDTPYGLAAYVQSGSMTRASEFAAQLRAGQVLLNGADLDFGAPFGGYKQSGNGREWGDIAFHDFLEIKAVVEPAQ